MNPWYAWLYHYGVGGLLFVAAVVVLFRSGAIELRRRESRRLLAFLVAGLIGFAVGHALWIRLAAG